MRPGEKAFAEPIKVSHVNLTRFSEESPYRSVCPVCTTGVLLVSRHPNTFKLINLDRCTFCAQVIIYSDAIIAGEHVTDVTTKPPPLIPSAKPN
jgi:hypothetical protein